MRERSGPRRTSTIDTGVWQDATDALIAGLRKTFDYQRSIADDYRARFLDQPPRSSDPYRAEWADYTSGVADYATDVFSITVDYYRSLADAAGRYVEATYPDMFATSPARRYFGPGGRETERASLEMRGRLGEEVIARFAVENSDDDAAEVFVEVGPCRDERGESVAIQVTIDPDALVVGPGGSETIEARLCLEPDAFDVGEYRFPIRIHGPDPVVIDVTLRVGEPERGDSTGVGRRPAADSGEVHRVRCPSCRRVFERATPNLRLRPHNDADGAPCAEREGVRAG